MTSRSENTSKVYQDKPALRGSGGEVNHTPMVCYSVWSGVYVPMKTEVRGLGGSSSGHALPFFLVCVGTRGCRNRQAWGPG